MYKLYWLTLLLFLISTLAQAQWGPQRAAGDLAQILETQNRKIVVELHEENPKMLKKLSRKPEKLADYKQMVADLNSRTKIAIEQFWTFGSSKPIFETTSVIKNWEKEKDKNYTILSFQTFEPEHNYGIGADRKTVSYPDARLLSARLSENWEFFSFVILPSYRPELGEMVFAVQLLQEHFNNSIAGISKPDHLKRLEAQKILPNAKILLLDEKYVPQKLTYSEIQEAYPYPVEVVPYSTIEKAILNRDARYAFVQFVPKYAKEMSAVVHVIADAENGMLLGYSNPTIIIPGRPIVNNSITKSELRRYAKFVR